MDKDDIYMIRKTYKKGEMKWLFGEKSFHVVARQSIPNFEKIISCFKQAHVLECMATHLRWNLEREALDKMPLISRLMITLKGKK